MTRAAMVRSFFHAPREVVPNASRVAFLSNPANPGNVLAVGNVKAAARSSGVQLQLLEA
jgi:ABC-type uncharacterized transport system substrate-binding protein